MPPGFDRSCVAVRNPKPLPDEPMPELPIPLGPLFEPLFEKPKLELPLFVGLFADAAAVGSVRRAIRRAPPFVPDVLSIAAWRIDARGP